MNMIDLSVLNLKEVRRRSLIVWNSMPNEYLSWKPDEEAMTIGQIIRHVWCGQVAYHEILKRGKSVEFELEEEQYPIENVHVEINWSQAYFERFLRYVSDLSIDEFDNRMIDRSNVGYVRSLGDMLARIAYHESVHTGQLLQYMRTAGLQRPNIWD